MTKQSEYKLKFNRRKKEKAINLFGGKCQICGYDKCMGALDFHHINGEKEHNISTILIQLKWERVKEELDKCILLCSNCHREVHYNHVNYDLIHLKRPWIKKICFTCKEEFDTKIDTQKYCCLECQRFSLRKTIRPNKDELQKLILDDSISWIKIGKMFGVSDNAVRKWAKSYNLLAS
jgi:hypothetical protein